MTFDLGAAVAAANQQQAAYHAGLLEQQKELWAIYRKIEASGVLSVDELALAKWGLGI